MVRFDLLKTLDPFIHRALAEVPPRDDSQVTPLNKPLRVQCSQVLATKVGYTWTGAYSSFNFGSQTAALPTEPGGRDCVGGRNLTRRR